MATTTRSRRAEVLAVLVDEADLDGVVTVSNHDIAFALGMSPTGASHVVRDLLARGVLTRLSRGNERGVYRLSPEVLA